MLSKSKQDKVKVINSKKLPKFKLWNFTKTLYATHLPKLLNRMCKYEMDPISIVEVTERTRFCPQTDGRTDGQTDGRRETSILPFNFVEAAGMISVIYLFQNNVRRLLHNWHISCGLHNYTHQNIDMDCHRMLYFPHCPRVQHHLCSNIRQGWQTRSKGRETRRGVGDVSVPGNI